MGIRIGIGNLAIGSSGGQSWSSYWAQQNEVSLDLQPAESTAKDTVIYKSAPTFNRGVFATITIGENNSGVDLVFRGLLQFDLSSIPENAVITEALLYLHHDLDFADNAHTKYVYRMKRAWLEGTGNDSATADGATWNTYDGANNWAVAGAFSATDCEQTPIGEKIFTASEPNDKCAVFRLNATTKAGLDLGFGWLIKSANELNDGYRFDSSSGTTVWLRPALKVSYHFERGKQSRKFVRHAANPFLKGRFGSPWYNGVGDYVFYYSNETNVYRATSTNGLVWTSAVDPVMVPIVGAGNKIDVVYYFKEGAVHYILYRSNEWGAWAIGLATSNDGITWTKHGSNPVIAVTEAWENGKIDPWGLIKVGSIYYLFINDVSVTPRQTGFATSTDLVNWTKNPTNPIFDNNIFCVQPFKYKNKYYLLTSDCKAIAATDDKVETKKISLWRSNYPYFPESDRQFLGVILDGGGLGGWDGRYLDTPCILSNDIYRDTFPNGDELWMYYCGLTWAGFDEWWHGLAIGSLDKISKLNPVTRITP